MEQVQWTSYFRTKPIAGLVNFKDVLRHHNRLFLNVYKIIENNTRVNGLLIYERTDDYLEVLNNNKIFLQLLKEKIIKSFSARNDRINGLPFFYRFGITANYDQIITDGNIPQRSYAHGFGLNLETTVNQAIYEFLERLPLTIYFKKDLIYDSWKNLQRKYRVLNPENISGFDEEQKRIFPNRNFDKNSKFYWEKVKRWSTGETLYVPAQYVYWNYRRVENEPYLIESNTNGCAGHWSREGAILYAIYELVQRDSFLYHWLNKITPKRIDPETIPDQEFQSLYEKTIKYGLEVYVLDCTTDLMIPSFCVIIHDPSENGVCYGLGAGCHIQPLKAIKRALFEAWSVVYWISYLKPFPSFKEVKPIPYYDYKITQDYRLRLWANSEMRDKLDFFINTSKISFYEIYKDGFKIFDSLKDELDFVVKKIENLGEGYEVYYFLSDNPFLKKIGYYSAKAIVPNLLTLYLNEADIIKKSPRLISQEINPLPHLFP